MFMFNSILFIIYFLLHLTTCRTNDYCSAVFCNNSKQHILCKYPTKDPGTNCVSFERTIFSDMDRRLLLDKINNRRNKVAAGEIRSLPPAAGMRKLEWNSELERSAQRWADQCVKHRVPDLKDTCRDLVHVRVGQNIATVQGDSPGLTPLALVDVWYMELLKLNSSVISRYVPSSEVEEAHYDYFTQLVWEETKEVGCGAVKFQERLDVAKYRTVYRLVCNFAPAGNRRNKTVYSCGLPCSGCPDGICDHEYRSLCESKRSVPISDNIESETYDEDITFQTKSFLENTTKNAEIETTTVTVPTSTVDTSDDKEYYTFDYFPHLYGSKILKESISPIAKDVVNKEVFLNEFIELLKKKLQNDPMVKDFLPKSTSGVEASDISFNDEGVAAFVSRIYSKKGQTTTSMTTPSDTLNSTLLVDLIEAVIFRSNDKLPTTVANRQDGQTIPIVKPVKVQAELAQVNHNREFTGHYFFPEEDDESSSETAEMYYDTNFAQSDVEMEIEHLKMSSITRDFLDDIFESESSPEKICNVPCNRNNVNKNYLIRPLKRKRRDTCHGGNKFQKTECTCQYHNEPTHSPDCENCNGNKKYVSYKVLLRKIATDLRKLKLNDIFHCTRNRSVLISFRPLLLFFVWLLLY